jgi:GntR family transcriptional regulator
MVTSAPQRRVVATGSLGPLVPDRDSTLPLWTQVCDDLRRRIDLGEFPETFPGEIALTEQYEVSRHTIREALRVLRDEGIVRSERGRASTVEAAAFSQRLDTLYSLFSTMDERGIRQRSVVHRLSTTTNPTVAERLGLRAQAKLVVLERTRIADDSPLAHDTAWLPWQVARPLLSLDFADLGLYAALEERCGVRVDSGSELISAQVAPRHIKELLELPPGVAVQYIERTAYAGATAVEWRETYIRGDRFSLEASWSPHQSSLTSVSGPQRRTD